MLIRCKGLILILEPNQIRLRPLKKPWDRPLVHPQRSIYKVAKHSPYPTNSHLTMTSQYSNLFFAISFILENGILVSRPLLVYKEGHQLLKIRLSWQSPQSNFQVHLHLMDMILCSLQLRREHSTLQYSYAIFPIILQDVSFDDYRIVKGSIAQIENSQITFNQVTVANITSEDSDPFFSLIKSSFTATDLVLTNHQVKTPVFAISTSQSVSITNLLVQNINTPDTEIKITNDSPSGVDVSLTNLNLTTNIGKKTIVIK